MKRAHFLRGYGLSRSDLLLAAGIVLALAAFIACGPMVQGWFA
jgi:hypothetical protein